MYNKSKNNQVIYSLNTLSDSLIKLLETDNLNDITITEICNSTNLSRKTFYRNCENVLDLILYKIDKLLTILINQTNWESSDVEKLYTAFFIFWYKERCFLSTLKKHDLFYLFTISYNSVMRNVSYPFLNNILYNKENKNDFIIFYNAFIIGGLVQVLEKWTETNFKADISSLVEIMCKLAPEH